MKSSIVTKCMTFLLAHGSLGIRMLFLISLLGVIQPSYAQKKWRGQLTVELYRVDKIGSIEIGTTYKDIRQASKNVFFAQKHDRRWGIIDSTNQIRIPFQYALIAKYIHGEYFIIDWKGKMGILSPKLEFRIECIYDDLWCIEVGSCKAKLNNRWGLLDSAANEILPFEYQDITYSMKKDFFHVRNEEGWGLIDSLGFTKIAQRYERLPKTYLPGYQLAIDEDAFDLYHIKTGHKKPLDIDSVVLVYNQWNGIVIKDSLYGIYDPQTADIYFPFDEVVFAGTTTKSEQCSYFVRDGLQWGIYNNELGYLSAVNYDKPLHFTSNYFKLTRNGLSQIVSKFGKVIIPETDLEIEKEFFESYLLFLLKKDEIVQKIFNKDGVILVSDSILEISPRNNNDRYSLEIRTPTGWRIFSAKNEKYVTEAHEEIRFLQRGYHMARSTEGWRLLNDNGKSAKQYHNTISSLASRINLHIEKENPVFITGTAFISADNNLDYKYGVINKYGETLVEDNYIQISKTSDTTLVLMTTPGWGLTYNIETNTIDSTLREHYYRKPRRNYTTSPSPMARGPFIGKLPQLNDQLSIGQTNLIYTAKGWKISNLEGESKQLVDGITYIDTEKKLGIMDGGIHYFWKDGKIGLLGEDLSIVLDPQFDDLVSAKQMPGSQLKYSYVRQNDKYALLDYSGKVLTPFKYDEIRAFQEGMARVRIGEKWGFITTTGEERVPPIYLNVAPFTNGLSEVKTENGTLAINKDNVCKLGCE